MKYFKGFFFPVLCLLLFLESYLSEYDLPFSSTGTYIYKLFFLSIKEHINCILLLPPVENHTKENMHTAHTHGKMVNKKQEKREKLVFLLGLKSPLADVDED